MNDFLFAFNVNKNMSLLKSNLLIVFLNNRLYTFLLVLIKKIAVVFVRSRHERRVCAGTPPRTVHRK